MNFVSPEGRREILWVEATNRPGAYRVLNVPVWIYGVSIGTVVAGVANDTPYLEFTRVIRESPGGTARFIVPEGSIASEIYLRRVLPDARQRGFHIGPATFFNPPLVAMHVRERNQQWPALGEYLDSLANAGVIEQWEVGDPERQASDEHEADEQTTGSILIHPLPVDGEEGQNVS